MVVKDTSGKEETFSGFNLIDLLVKAGFSLAEADPVFSNKLIMLADQLNGQPLGKHKGPYRIIIPDESRHALWIWGVQVIAVGAVKL